MKKIESKSKINLVLCWHMHQPYYRDALDGEYVLPWVYLHGIKDYDDMAAHFERYPNMRAVVNFAPVLLEQLDDYANQIEQYLTQGVTMRDPMLNLLAGAIPIPDEQEARKQIISDCSRAHAPRMIDPYPVFKSLSELYSCTHDEEDCECELMVNYLSPQFFLDLLSWYHLAWMSHALKQTPAIKRLIKQGGNFSDADRRELLQIIGKSVQGIIPRFRKLSEQGQIEISMTPYGHPIVPLLNSFENMSEAQPGDPLPIHSEYPSGRERSMWHLQHGLRVFEKFFGHQPKGVWLSEGGVSGDAIELLDELGIEWTATGEAVWHNSCCNAEPGQSDLDSECCAPSSCGSDDPDRRKGLFMPYRLNSHQTNLFFRDDGLSDLIGFEYSNWHSDDAVANFVHHLQNIGESLGEHASEHVVSVILDGENAWEYYPNNGHFFLDNLYKTLSESDAIAVKTFTDIRQESGHHTGKLSSIVPGSWVYGSFSTWIGSEEKNYAWDLLVQAKQQWDEVIASGNLTKAQIEAVTRQLAICEGSDWFWWFGDYNPSGSVSDFDRLYRRQLMGLYQLMGVDAPEILNSPISEGGGDAENSGTMRRNS
ncbi:MAG: glycoside hydrolase family 57 protein [Gammaproteobacteria bacterium]|nr:glycoside hydrolase family 57 protein [Gammaproteobacteria bacterium]